MVLRRSARRLIQNRKRRKKLLLMLLLIRRMRTIRTPIRRRFWVRDIYKNREQFGTYYHLFKEMREGDPEKFFNYFRMTRENFDELTEKVTPLLKKMSPSHKRKSIPVGLKLAATLRYLASGDSMKSLSYSERVGTSTMSGIIRETCNAIWLVLNEEVLPTPSEDDWKNITQQNFDRWNFPNCAGSIDGKHVVIQAPALSGSAFFNYKNQHSIVLMASCDANYCFTFVDIGGAGRQSDGGVFGQAKFGQAILDETLPLPPPMSIFGYTLPCVFVADAAFPLRNNLMRPYPSSSAEPDNFVFNYRLSRVRRMIENCFGILASRWRIYRKPIIATVPTIEAIVKATVCLHNWLQKFSNMKRTRYCPAGLIDEEDEDGVVTQGTWRNTQMAGLVPLPRAGANRCAQSAKAVRDELRSYFVNEGAVPWQWTRLHR